MASQRHIINICDVCGVEDTKKDVEVKTHTLLVDGQATELETCGPCWDTHAAGLEKLVEVGRKIPRKKVA